MLRHLALTLVFITCTRTDDQLEQCSAQVNDETNTKTPGICYQANDNKYKKAAPFTRYIHQVELAESTHTPVNSSNCSCYLDVIARDLSHFSPGVTKQMIEKVRDKGTKYQIINHRLYRQKDCLFPARCSGIEYFLLNILNDLPDLDVIINTRDHPQTPNYFSNTGPLLSFSKTSDYLDIMYPAWSFWAGGPAISFYPTGLGRWDRQRQTIGLSGNKTRWQHKKSIGFFRGSRTSSERDNLILLSRNKPELVDAKYTKNQAWKSEKDTLNAPPAREVTLEDHCQYKYLFNFRGVAASFRFKHLFLCKSLVFQVGEDWREFFYDQLKPWYHYIPVPNDASADELESLIGFVRDNDRLAEKIAFRGFEFVWNHLRLTDVKCYWRELLVAYAKLLKFPIERDWDLMEIRKR